MITTPMRTRSLDFEREFTRAAARKYVDAEPLITHAEARASSLSSDYVPDPMLIAPGRDRLHDGMEEGADWRNHLAFVRELLMGHDEIGALVDEAMSYVALAYDRTRRARELAIEEGLARG